MILVKCPNCGNAVLLTNSSGISHVKCCSCGYEQRLSDCKTEESGSLNNASSSSIEELIPIMEERITQFEKEPNEILTAAIEFGVDCNVLIEILNAVKRRGLKKEDKPNGQSFVTLEPGIVPITDINSRLDLLDGQVKQIPHQVFGTIRCQTNDAVMALNNEIDELEGKVTSLEGQLGKVVAELQRVKERLSKYELI